MKRKIIKIDENKCNGCGKCIPNCPEGALRIIDGKARLISDLFCDGLGACMGHCPEDAISVEERESRPYNEKKVMDNIIKGGPNVIRAHLEHLLEHGEKEFFAQAVKVLEERDIDIPGRVSADKEKKEAGAEGLSGCPGAGVRDFGVSDADASGKENRSAGTSRLRQWPVQLHLLPPTASFLRGRDLVLAADCVAYAVAGFHEEYLSGKALAIACPKLDTDREIYVRKLTDMVDNAGINTLTVMIMEVPCCGGLLAIAEKALSAASRRIPLKAVTVGIDGSIKKDEWVRT
jgi:NAD-dependent dihydropyrimidine dehydrogenase PreA subunit